MGVQDPSDALRQDTVDAILSHFGGPSNPVPPKSRGNQPAVVPVASGPAILNMAVGESYPRPVAQDLTILHDFRPAVGAGFKPAPTKVRRDHLYGRGMPRLYSSPRPARARSGAAWALAIFLDVDGRPPGAPLPGWRRA